MYLSKKLQESLKKDVKLAYLKKNHAVNIYKNVSKRLFAVMIMKFQDNNGNWKPNTKQYKPLVYLVSNRGEHSKISNVYNKKKFFATVMVFNGMEYDLYKLNFVLEHTDHCTLFIVFFVSLKSWLSLPKNRLCKSTLMDNTHLCFYFTIKHVQGTKNLLANLLVRWTRGYRSNTAGCKRTTILCQSNVLATERFEENTRQNEKKPEQRTTAGHSYTQHRGSIDNKWWHLNPGNDGWA